MNHDPMSDGQAPSSTPVDHPPLLGRSAHGRTIALVASFVIGLLFAVMSHVDAVDRPAEPPEGAEPSRAATATVASSSEITAVAVELQVIAPSDWIDRVRPGSRFRFHADDGGQVLDGHVVRLGPAQDRQAGTIRVVGTLTSVRPTWIRTGLHGRADFGAVGAVPASIGRSAAPAGPARSG